MANLVQEGEEESRKGLSPRAFGFVVDELDKRQEALLLAIAFYELIITRHMP